MREKEKMRGKRKAEEMKGKEKGGEGKERREEERKSTVLVQTVR